MARLSDDRAMELRERYAAGAPQKELAAEFGFVFSFVMSRTTAWPWIPDVREDWNWAIVGTLPCLLQETTRSPTMAPHAQSPAGVGPHEETQLGAEMRNHGLGGRHSDPLTLREIDILALRPTNRARASANRHGWESCRW